MYVPARAGQYSTWMVCPSWKGCLLGGTYYDHLQPSLQIIIITNYQLINNKIMMLIILLYHCSIIPSFYYTIVLLSFYLQEPVL